MTAFSSKLHLHLSNEGYQLYFLVYSVIMEPGSYVDAVKIMVVQKGLSITMTFIYPKNPK